MESTGDHIDTTIAIDTYIKSPNRQSPWNCQATFERVAESESRVRKYISDPTNDPTSDPTGNPVSDTTHTSCTHEFIAYPEYLLEALRDMHMLEEATMFENSAGDLQFILQSTSEATDEMMTFEIALLYDEAQDQHGKIRRILDLEFATVPNEDGNWTFYLGNLTQTPESEDLIEAAESINALRDIRICECFEYFIKTPGRHICYMCTMRRLQDEVTRECVICNDPIRTRLGSIHMTCCDQYMHKRCLELWRRDDSTKICPICRMPSKQEESVS